MEIQKIFSNVEDPEENLYSVLLTEEEMALFSDKVKLDTDTHDAVGAASDMYRHGVLTGAIVRHQGKKAAKRAAEEGKSEGEVINDSRKAARKASAIIGGAQTAAAAGTTGYLVHKGLKAAEGKGGREIRKGLRDLAYQSGGKEGVATTGKIINKALKNKGKVATAAALGVGALTGATALYNRRRAGQNAAELTEKRIIKGKEKKD